MSGEKNTNVPVRDLSVKQGFKLSKFLVSWEMVLIYILLLINIVLMVSRTNLYFSNGTIQAIIQSGMDVCPLVLGMILILMLGDIDVSVAATMIFASMATGLCCQSGVPAFAAVIVGIAAGALCGLFNGFFVAYMEVPAFVATLAGMTIARGFAYVYSDGKPYTLNSPKFRIIGQGMAPIIIFLAILLICHIVLSKMKFGRYIYATGGNIKAAEASGVNTKKILMKVYILAGTLSGIAGIVLASRTNSGQPAVGTGFETDAIAAAVIGGTSMTGGIGTIPGTLVGILIIGTLNNSLNLLNVSSYYQQIIKGIIILGAVCFDIVSKKIQNVKQIYPSFFFFFISFKPPFFNIFYDMIL